MNESSTLSKFDALVKSGTVQYDDKQKSIRHVVGELEFQFLLTSALAGKPTIKVTQPQVEDNSAVRHERLAGSDISTRGFEIGDIGSTHFLVANKFCLARPHLLLLTFDGHRKQYESLNETDLQAAWTVLTTTGSNYVSFYNCGQDGGCSRSHKHLQIMPMPNDSFASFLDKGDKEPNIPFHWFHRGFESQHITPATLTNIYTELLKEATKVGDGRSEHASNAQSGAACPHNMIFTKRWMLVIPRRRGATTKGLGLNAIGMLGLIPVATKDEISVWIEQGLIESLSELGVPK